MTIGGSQKEPVSWSPVQSLEVGEIGLLSSKVAQEVTAGRCGALWKPEGVSLSWNLSG